MNETTPQHDTMSLGSRAIELASILAAIGLVIALVFRFSLTPGMLTWSTPVVCILAMFAADFMSGMLHWFADTWGRDAMPVSWTATASTVPRTSRESRRFIATGFYRCERGCRDARCTFSDSRSNLASGFKCRADLRTLPGGLRYRRATDKPDSSMGAHEPSTPMDKVASRFRPDSRSEAAPETPRGAVQQALLHHLWLLQRDPGHHQFLPIAGTDHYAADGFSASTG